jgi:tetratricopeptide (TPR) repeat protein
LGDLFRLQWAEFENAFGFIAAADWDGAAAAMESGITVNRRGGYPHFAAWYAAHLGWLARLRGRDDEAVTLGRQALAMSEDHEHAFWKAGACALLGTTVLQRGDRDEAIGLFRRGLAAAADAAAAGAGAEAYLLRCAAPLAAATGSSAELADADRMLGQVSIPDGGAWLLGEEAYLALAQAWLGHGEPERSRAVLAPLLALAERGPWLPTLAATLAADGRALARLGEADRARERLMRAGRLAREHGLPHVRRDAESALRSLR